MRRSGPKGSRVPLRVAAVLSAVSACDAGDATAPPPVPASVVIAPDSALLTYLGEAVRFTATVRGGTGGEAPVRWSSTDEAVVTVDGAGLVTARANGTAEVRATAAGARDAAAVRVEQRVAAMEAFGDGQRVLAGLSVTRRVGVRVKDAGGRPVAGTDVTFTVSVGGGSVAPASMASNGGGVASPVWTLGETLGDQTLIASVAAGLQAEITVTAVGPDSAVATIELIEGGGQSALAGRRLPVRVGTRVVDGLGRPIPGAVVTFATMGGFVVPDSVRTHRLARISHKMK